jgi:hypothetical protein
MLESRRDFLAAASGVALSGLAGSRSLAQQSEPKTRQTVSVDLPLSRVPLSFIIDDSTCLVNMGKFCMPQFAATYPDRQDYQKPWQEWPDEIPDSFVRHFGSWCAEQGVKGKYSIVPYPACVGWLDRALPGWSQSQLNESLKLVRELMVPNWDIHPEMITHTRVIDLKTGRPFADFSPSHMENSFPQEEVSVDYLASYLAYALQILKNCDLPCEGITTPGGFGNRVKDKLPLAVFQAVRDVYGSELPHYFKYVSSGDESTEPRLEAVRDADSDSPSVTANVPAGTGDWFGGWDGALESQGSKYATNDASSGRMVELIEQRRPAIMLCHWAGLYGNGSQQGYRDFQQVVLALDKRFKDQTRWMKVSEIGRYWVAKELTHIEPTDEAIKLRAPFACPNFTLRVGGRRAAKIVHHAPNATHQLHSVSTLASLNSGSFYVQDETTSLCFDLAKGENTIAF